MNLQDTFLRAAEEYFPPLSKPVYPMVIERGEGSYLYDMDGKQYIDFATGIAIAPIGHCHPKVVQAIQDQAGSLVASMNILNPKVKIECAELIRTILPKGLDTIFFSNSGAEAVDGALKLARKARPGRPNFIAFNKAFHGRTMGAMSVSSSKASYRKDFYPLMPGCHFVDYPCHCTSLEDTLSQLENLFEYNCSPETVSAIIVEPIIGEGGYIVPPDDFLPKLREICDQHGILLICDEIQTGFGRTGKWFACEHTGIMPDIITFAKGVASGMPLGGFAAPHELMSHLELGSHGSTFGGNPVSCAAAIATINTIQSSGLIEKVSVLGIKILERLTQKFGEYLDIRGRGFMIGIEPKPNIELNIKNILNRLHNKGLIALSCGHKGQVLRIVPALNISESILNDGLGIIEQVLDYEILVFQECKRLETANG